jgi:hypothetical protein
VTPALCEASYETDIKAKVKVFTVADTSGAKVNVEATGADTVADLVVCLVAPNQRKEAQFSFGGTPLSKASSLQALGIEDAATLRLLSLGVGLTCTYGIRGRGRLKVPVPFCVVPPSSHATTS